MIAKLTDRAVLRLTGSDARPFLQGLLTNNVDKLAPNAPLWAGLLSPQGKYLFDMILYEDDSAILIDVDATRVDELLKRLTLYKLRRDLTLERTSLGVFAAWDGESDGPFDPRLAGLGRRWIADRAEPTATVDDYDAHRLALGMPDSRDFMVDKLMWLETNAAELNGVSFTKGCYVGQENTARMHHRDKLRRRLLPVRLSAEPGQERLVRAGGREAGELRSYRGDRGIAYLRLEYIDGPLRLADAAVTVDWPSWLPSVVGSGMPTG